MGFQADTSVLGGQFCPHPEDGGGMSTSPQGFTAQKTSNDIFAVTTRSSNLSYLEL
jgi:hypothetical protein